MNIRDVRASMPNHERYAGVRRAGAVAGIAIHHSATANRVTGLNTDTAASIFEYHVRVRGWSRGGYHYLVHPNGVIEYAIDERTPVPHAAFVDKEDRHGLEQGQYWNNHWLAVCLLGWFDRDRALERGQVRIPDWFTAPSAPQWRAAVLLLEDLARRHGLDETSIRGHRELGGCRTACPGSGVNLDALRSDVATRLREARP